MSRAENPEGGESDPYASVPGELKNRPQWLLWDASAETPRRPHWKGDFGISWSDPECWHTFGEAVQAAQTCESWGIGYVMAADNDDYTAGVYGCIDIDGAYDEGGELRDWVPDLSAFTDALTYIEYSPSGNSLHIPIVASDVPEWWSDSEIDADLHQGVDVLTNKFCTFTGDTHADSGSSIAGVDPTNWLFEAYQNIRGESPRLSDPAGADYDGDEYLEASDIENALGAIDPDIEHTEWVKLGYAVHDFDDGATGKSLFESWSKRGSKYDDKAQRTIDSIWSNADSGTGVTLGTLIHKAKQNGWSVPNPKGSTGENTTQAPSRETTGWDAIYRQYTTASEAEERKPARFQAAELLSEEYHWSNLEENDQLYAYNPDRGVYEPNGEKRVRELLVENLKEEYAKNEKNELLDQLRGRHTVSQDEMGGPKNHIPVRNGVLEVHTTGIELKDHAPEYRFLGAVDTEYDPDAECPQFRSFLNDVVQSGAGRKKLQEYAGYTLMHWGLPHHKALFLVGPTASGKSTFLDTIRAVLGSGTVVSLTPQELTSERFAGAELFQSWANFRNDIPSSLIEDTGAFKEITAGDSIKAERKFKDPFRFEPTAKHLFSANQLPDAETEDEAFYRRVLLVPFPSSVPRSKRDEHLDEKLQSELPGVLNWMLEGLQRLMQQGKFTADRTPGETQRTWEQWGNTVDRFREICLEKESGAELPKKTVYRAYHGYCEAENLPAETQHKMTRRLKSEGIADGRAYVDGKRQRVFVGVELNEKGESYLPSAEDNDGGTGPGLGDFGGGNADE